MRPVQQTFPSSTNPAPRLLTSRETFALSLPSADLLRLFDEILNASIFAGTEEQYGSFLPSVRSVRRLGLALEPWPTFTDWVAAKHLDAVFLHRPWSLTDEQRHTLQTAGVGILAYHLAFDERLTTGFNPALAAACGWGEPEILGQKAGRPLGMSCALPTPTTFNAVAAQLSREFAGLDQITPPASGGEVITRVAVVGAMTDALVREAHARGVGVYVTGQWRQPARAAVQATGLGVVPLGHRRSELWGLRTLDRLLRAHPDGANLVTMVHES